MAGQGYLILNTLQAAADLLDRRGEIYGDRPRFIRECRFSSCFIYMTTPSQFIPTLSLPSQSLPSLHVQSHLRYFAEGASSPLQDTMKGACISFP